MGITMTPTQEATTTTLANTGLLFTEPMPKAKTRLINELVQGRDWTTQLQILLDESSGNHGSLSARQMVEKILRSFTESISVLSCDNNTESSVLCEVSLPNSDDIGSENSIESKKRLGSKIGRGCYKRRKPCQSWTKVEPTTEDGHAWRKYGQKEILNASYPRCYFRCTHKFDQGCKAIKQVQRMEDNPQMYKITYIGVHTCKEIINSPQIIRDSDPWESYINNSETKPAIFGNRQELNFTHATVKREHKEGTNASDNFIVKKEQKEETTKDNLGNLNGTFDEEHDGDSIWKNDLSGFGSPEPMVTTSKAENFLDDSACFNMNNSCYYPCVDDSSNGFADLFLRFEGLADGDFHFDACEFS